MKNDKMTNQYRVNEQIRAREVRIVSDGGAEVMPTRQALELARQQGVDLVEISPNAQTASLSHHRLFKVLYQQKKHQKEMKQKQAKVDIKEIRFGPQTDEHDYQLSLNMLRNSLTEAIKFVLMCSSVDVQSYLKNKEKCCYFALQTTSKSMQK